MGVSGSIRNQPSKPTTKTELQYHWPKYECVFDVMHINIKYWYKLNLFSFHSRMETGNVLWSLRCPRVLAGTSAEPLGCNAGFVRGELE